MFSTTMKLALSLSLLLASCSGLNLTDVLINVCEGGGASFSAHGRVSVNFYGTLSDVNGGAVGVSPGTSITGFTGTPVTPAVAATFAAHALSDHTDLTDEDTDDDMGGAVELGGSTYTPGVHSADTSLTVSVNTQVTLKGEGDYLFQAGTTLTTGANANFVLQDDQGLAGDPDNFNIVWVLGTGATLGAGSIVPGTITAGTAITIGAGSGVTGCAIAQTSVVFSGGGCANCP